MEAIYGSKEVQMIRIQIPLCWFPPTTPSRLLAFVSRKPGLRAYREIAVAAKGLEIAHLQLSFTA